MAAGVEVRGYVSCIFVDPYDGPTEPSSVLHCVQALLKMGCYEVSLGDTTGAGTPAKVATLIRYLKKNNIPLHKIAGHFHDTYGKAVANVLQAYLCGINVFDASVGGLGGCPFAPGAKGNVSTEDLAHMFHTAGIHTGINLAELTATGNWIKQQIRGCSSSPSLSSSSTLDDKELPPQLSMEKKIRVPHFHPINFIKASLKRGKYNEQLQIFQTGNDVNLILNRPQKRNALNRSMIIDLIKSLKMIDSDTSVSRIIIMGTGKYFCAGIDLREDNVEKGDASGADDLVSFELLIHLLDAIGSSAKPVIACLNGHACGAGVALAFACDERIMVQKATIKLSRARRSLFMDLVTRYVRREWDATVSPSRDFNLSTRPMSASKLQILGLVTEVVDGKKDLQAKLGSYLFVKESSIKTALPMEKT